MLNLYRGDEVVLVIKSLKSKSERGQNEMNRNELRRNLVVVSVSYVVIMGILLVIYRFTAMNTWEELWDALILPRVWVTLLLALVFILGMQVVVYVSPSGIVARELKRSLEPLGRICWYLGVVVIAILAFTSVDPVVRLNFTALGLAIFAIGTGFISLSVSNKSDDRMIAIANLQLFEKMAVVQAYIKDLTQPDSEGWNKAYADRIYYDVKGAKELEQWVRDPELKVKFNEAIQELLDKALKGQKHEHLIKRLYELKGNENMLD